MYCTQYVLYSTVRSFFENYESYTIHCMYDYVYSTVLYVCMYVCELMLWWIYFDGIFFKLVDPTRGGKVPCYCIKYRYCCILNVIFILSLFLRVLLYSLCATRAYYHIESIGVNWKSWLSLVGNRGKLCFDLYSLLKGAELSSRVIPHDNDGWD